MKNLVPKRRFEEFKDSDPWEQCKLGDIGEFKSNGVDKKINKNDFSVCLLNYMDVYNRINLTNGNRNKLMQVTATTKQIEANNIEANDVFFTPSSETADDIGRVMVVEETLENTVYSYHLMRFRPHKNIFYSIFPNYVFETTFFRKQMILEAQGVQRFVLNRDAFENLIVTMPELKEQKLISEFFRSLDNLITLHQRKLDKLKETKSAYLSEMFPKEGELYPKRRFAGFTDPWEQRKLGEIADKAVDNRGKTPPLDSNGTHPLIEVASLGTGSPDYSKVEKFLNDYSFEHNLRDYIKKGDILFSTVGSIGLVSLMDDRENAAIAQNIVAFRAKENYSPEYLYALFSTESSKIKAYRIVMGAVQPSIKVSQLVDVKYFVTNNKEEQKLIGDFFIKLDNLITLHQRKLDKLQALKQAYLSEMFV